MTTPQLDYAPAPTKQWKRRARWIALILVLAMAATAANRYGPTVLHQFRRIYLAKQCMAFTIPPGTVLSESDPARAKMLLAKNPNYIPVNYSSGTVAVYHPHCWMNYAAVDPRCAGLRGLLYHPIIFLHERRTPSGQPRLVAVSSEWANGYDMHILMDRVGIPPPTLFSVPTAKPSGGFAYSGPYVEVTFSPGVADPADPTHFSIDFTLPDRIADHPVHHGTLDGYLRDDDTVQFKVRDPATTQNL